ncbi:hypothetical protein I7I53_03514 [Histoplasma capsulatum var. duboisii H88]|uniref:Uncharacterized protein n=1 Tax=Ajellomyces capsulatus (strain H88) TaxID=544711 RepID=A0A8A1LR40_AJEC8|nr:hypothetical protein I7I53_03514 [Histoplasma capsulatum var. duboisii H88]
MRRVVNVQEARRNLSKQRTLVMAGTAASLHPHHHRQRHHPRSTKFLHLPHGRRQKRYRQHRVNPPRLRQVQENPSIRAMDYMAPTQNTHLSLMGLLTLTRS